MLREIADARAALAVWPGREPAAGRTAFARGPAPVRTGSAIIRRIEG